MIVADIDLISRVVKHCNDNDIRLETNDPAATNLIDVTGEPKDIYWTVSSYGGSEIRTAKSTLYEMAYDLRLLNNDEQFDSGIISTGYNSEPIYRTSVIRPQWNR